jgi:ribosomal protein S6
MAKTKKVASSVEMLEPKVYEFGFLLSPAIREEDLDTHTDAIKNLITQAQGLVISEGRPEYIDIAYPMTKVIENKKHTYEQAYFGWIKFDVAPNHIDAIKNAVEAFPEIIRLLAITTVRENTIVSKKPLSTVVTKKHRHDDDVSEDEGDDLDAPAHEKLPEVINEEEIDKEIEDLVIN